MAVIFTIPRAFPVVGDLLLASGKIGTRALPGAKLEFYLANTTTPADTYVDAAQTTKHPWPVVADATGKFPVIWLPSGVNCDVVLKDAAGATLETYQDIDGGPDASGSDASEIGRAVEVGSIVWHSLPEVPAGWLRIKRDPQALIKSEYPELNAKYAADGYPYGSTATTFNIPGGAGLFPRIWDNTSTLDPESASRKDHATGTTTVGNLIGSRQASQNKSHTHAASSNSTGAHTHTFNDQAGGAAGAGSGGEGASGPDGTTSSAGLHSHTITVNNDGGVEARPDNIAFPMIIFVSPAQAATKHSTLGLPFLFATATADADPGLGYLRLNNATPLSATWLYISKTDALGSNVGTYIEAINLATGPVRALMTIHNSGQLGNSLAIHVTGALVDGGAYWKVPIAVKASLGALSQDARLAVGFSLAGSGSGTIAPVITTFTSSGTWTRTTGTTRAHVRGCGGGGGGGNVASASVSAAGGGAGGEFDFWLDIAAIASEVVTIGAGGAASANGGATSFGIHATANGGTAGGNASGSTPGAPGGGGTTTGLGGKNGNPGLNPASCGSREFSGAGGSSRYGGPGVPSSSTSGSAAGSNATGFGAGGSGASAAGSGSASGGTGAPGVVIIEEFY